jgi:putative Holliday junction resolvase
MSIIIGLDIGKKRTGIAKSDNLGIIIKPLKTVLTENLIQELKSLNEENNIEHFVIGEPINIEKGNNEAHEFVLKTKTEIEKNFNHVKTTLIDERFTSKEAQAALKQQGQKITKDNKDLIDMYAAAIILEQYFSFYSGDAMHENT